MGRLAKLCSVVVLGGTLMANAVMAALPQVLRSDNVYEADTAQCPNVVLAANGDLVVTFANHGDVLPPTASLFVRSSDGGKTWSDSYLRYDPTDKDNNGIMIGGMIRLSDGDILAYHSDILTPGGKLGVVRTTVTDVIRSKDNGKTFEVVSQVKSAADNLSAPYGPMVRLADGSIIMPGFIEYVGNGYWQTTDEGKTWSDFKVVWVDPPEGARQHLWFNETAYVVTDSGKIVSVARNDVDKIFYISESEDNGNTWINQRATNMVGGSPALHKLANGSLILGHRDFGRQGLAIYHSADEGQTWRYLYRLPVPEGVTELSAARWQRPADDQSWQPGEGSPGYPSFTDLPDGNIYVVWHVYNRNVKAQPGRDTYGIVGNVLSNPTEKAGPNGPTVFPVAQVGALLRGQTLTGPAALSQLVARADGMGMEVTASRIENRTSNDAEVHSAEDDIFYVLAGEATFHLGGTLHDTWDYSPGNQAGREQRGATEHAVGAGDVIVVPRGTVHRITCPDGFVELLIIKRLEK